MVVRVVCKPPNHSHPSHIKRSYGTSFFDSVIDLSDLDASRHMTVGARCQLQDMNELGRVGVQKCAG